MSTQEVFIQQFARLFHYYNDALTAERHEAHVSDASDEQHRLFAAARLAIEDLQSRPREDGHRRYFAKPGEAEWGC